MTEKTADFRQFLPRPISKLDAAPWTPHDKPLNLQGDQASVSLIKNQYHGLTGRADDGRSAGSATATTADLKRPSRKPPRVPAWGAPAEIFSNLTISENAEKNDPAMGVGGSDPIYPLETGRFDDGALRNRFREQLEQAMLRRGAVSRVSGNEMPAGELIELVELDYETRFSLDVLREAVKLELARRAKILAEENEKRALAALHHAAVTHETPTLMTNVAGELVGVAWL